MLHVEFPKNTSSEFLITCRANSYLNRMTPDEWQIRVAILIPTPHVVFAVLLICVVFAVHI